MSAPTVQMSYGRLKKSSFNQAFQKLMRTQAGLSIDTKVIIAEQVKAVMAAGEEATKKYLDEIVEKYAERDEAGKIVPQTADNANSFKVAEANRAEFEAAIKAHDETVVELKCRKLNVKNLSGAEVCAADLVALEDLIKLS